MLLNPFQDAGFKSKVLKDFWVILKEEEWVKLKGY